MSKVKMIAQKRMRYATRRLAAGDLFEASRRDANLLERIKLAKPAPTRAPVNLTPPPPDMPVHPIDPVIDAARTVGMADADEVRPKAPKVAPIAELRAEYQAVVGRRPFMGWGVDDLRTRIKAARG